MKAEERIAELEDALDHISRVADMSMVLTRRLNWIKQRALYAIQGEPWDFRNKDVPYPKNRLSTKLHHTEREAIEKVFDAVETRMYYTTSKTFSREELIFRIRKLRDEMLKD